MRIALIILLSAWVRCAPPWCFALCLPPRQTAEEQSAAFALKAGFSMRIALIMGLPDRRVVNKGQRFFQKSTKTFSFLFFGQLQNKISKDAFLFAKQLKLMYEDSPTSSVSKFTSSPSTRSFLHFLPFGRRMCALIFWAGE